MDDSTREKVLEIVERISERLEHMSKALESLESAFTQWSEHEIHD